MSLNPRESEDFSEDEELDGHEDFSDFSDFSDEEGPDEHEEDHVQDLAAA
jgi:hypothetical protein